MTENIYQLLVGVGIPIAIFSFGLWIKAELRNRRDYKEMSEKNESDHQQIRKDMDRHHQSLRDKIEQVWKHLVDKD